LFTPQITTTAMMARISTGESGLCGLSDVVTRPA
jgi:hypothetical protein